jgi:hypothetical protein
MAYSMVERDDLGVLLSTARAQDLDSQADPLGLTGATNGKVMLEVFVEWLDLCYSF